MTVGAALRWVIGAVGWLLATGAVAGLLLLGYALTRDANRSDIRSLEMELTTLLQETRKLEAAAAHLDQFRESAAELENRLEEAAEVLPGDRFDRLPLDLADESGVAASVEWKGETEGEFTRVRSVVISAEGRRDALLGFAGQVLALPALGLSHASLERADGGEAWTARFEGRAFEYRDVGE